ncbi:probable pectate lyase P59 [Gossypium hirsutum]|uniref:Probable pectate lyase P59 n=1 Tax=Gossypium hirsutum TaxID=3635 RepID=A0ABM3A191_GOSHI|nr:probable pectate lyase P59 [Gossypium hirsutum]
MITSLGPCSSFLSPKVCWQNKKKGPYEVTNPVDSYWRCDSDWEKNRKNLVNCAPGFARGTTGEKGGEFYVATDPIDNDADCKPGTLRHAVTQTGPLWITFKKYMTIKLEQELIVTSDKSVDVRGTNMEICNAASITVQFVKNVIIHGLYIHQIIPAKGGKIKDGEKHLGL